MNQAIIVAGWRYFNLLLVFQAKVGISILFNTKLRKIITLDVGQQKERGVREGRETCRDRNRVRERARWRDRETEYAVVVQLISFNNEAAHGLSHSSKMHQTNQV